MAGKILAEVKTDVRVRWAETDAAGIVYHGSYVVYLEVGRREFFRTYAPGWRHWEEAILLPMVSITCAFKTPAYYDEVLTVVVALHSIGRSSFSFTYRILKDNQVLCCRARSKHVVVDKNTFRPIPVPEWMLNLVERGK
ncbi:MAG: acyl-CoA thioesterase [Clostridia bacterium]|nr:MAG: acyl-CoA thioesterase [Clostridia bacterium]